MQALTLLRLGRLTGRTHLAEQTARTMSSQATLANRYPRLFGQLMHAVDFERVGPREIVVSGASNAGDTRALLQAVRTTFAPARVVALAGTDADVAPLPLLEGRTPDASGTKAYVCRDFTFKAPVSTAEDLRAELEA